MRYRVSFESKNGHWMVVEGEPAWRRSDVAEHEWAMIRGRQAPGLLRLELEETDGVIRFRYALAGCRMLTHALRAGPWTMREAMTALFRLAGTLSDSRLYMLEPHRFLLGEERVFAGRNGTDLWLAYLPVEDSRAEERFLPDLERLIVDLFVRVEDLDGSVFRRLILMLREPDFSPERLRDAARRWLHDAETGNAGRICGPTDAHGALEYGHGTAHDTADSLSAVSGWDDGALQNGEPQADPHSSDWRMRGLPGNGTRPAESAAWMSGFSEGHGDGRSENERNGGLLAAVETGLISAGVGEKTRKSNVAAVCGFVLAAALIWRFVPEWLPGPTGPVLAGGFTLLLAAGAAWFWLGKMRGKHGGQTAGAKEEEPANRGDVHAACGPPAFAAGKPDAWERSTGSPRHESGASERTVHPEPEEDEATVQLSHDAGSQGQQPRTPALEWSGPDGEPPKTIALKMSPFVIGRSQEAVHHVDRSPGVSRLHVEVALTADGWIARDLGSRNGTLLNGEPMTPYTPYPLKDGDVLRIAASVYRFTC
ncbi:MAG: hypothetical protein BAA02_01320 [Paenibacillaceae bacterium ZCTH02-B3]|nr:MAG: hypothetical protein BAA02_01320 [Paenibacillaceae bacterium ZCTH02-B3]